MTRIRRVCLSSLIALTLAGTALAQNAEASRDYDIAAGTLTQAINGISQQSGVQIVYDIKLLNDKKARTLKGRLSLKQALEQTLAGSGLTYEFANPSTVVIRKAVVVTPTSSGGASKGSVEVEDSIETLDILTVTGTRIRGATTPSPKLVISDVQIKQEGFADLGEVIRSIPQNFSGGQNPGVAAGSSAGGIANQNMTGGSALNLRGLGPDATLTLLNGRRMSYEAFVQAVDIGAIPVDAVQQIEIIPDGASAIYGSDAVAGVANVIMKRDFDGVSVGARYGAATEGGLDTSEYTLTAGTRWSSGGVIATYKDASVDPIYATDRDYTQKQEDPQTLYNGNDLRGGMFSVHQSLGDSVELQLDVLRNERGQNGYIGYPALYYRSKAQTDVTVVSPSIKVKLPADWTMQAGYSYADNKSEYWSYTTTRATGGTTLDAMGCYCNESRSYDVGVEGPLFDLPAGEVRLAVGAGSRSDDFLTHAYISGTKYGGNESSKFAYAEFSAPLVGPDAGLTAIRRIELNAAVRGEDYDSFGKVTTPKFGFIYEITGDIGVKASWGKSFKAPTLLQRYQNRISYLWTTQQMGGTGYPPGSTVLMSYGGNEHLGPERAESWTASLDFHPQAIPELNIDLSYFEIDYTDRVVQPLSPTSQTLSNPNFANFVYYAPTPEQQAQLLAEYSSRFYNYAEAPYDPANVVAIARDEYINAARQRVNGVDLSGSYRLDLGSGQLAFRGGVSWLDSTQQNNGLQNPFNLSGQIFNPAKWQGRVGTVWLAGGLSVGTFVNYTSSVTNTFATPHKATASFTTVDMTARYEMLEREDFLSGVTVALTVENLFNREPPLYTPPFAAYVPFDSTNYSAIGRFVAVSLTKHW
ncbi:TonB-dependent receptor domain-containing protein [Steroidobacter flavus]|uniref:TonB-dependent receptor domain-containing protein n=1 Tax=Steroidobacter flavus TaxID=1842136 RepID=A0ABV8STU5_9GAMM